MNINIEVTKASKFITRNPMSLGMNKKSDGLTQPRNNIQSGLLLMGENPLSMSIGKGSKGSLNS